MELIRGRFGQLREEYKFARDFFADLEKNPQMHPFLRQKGYQAIACDNRLASAEIEYLLTLQDSPQALKDYVLGRQYINHLATATGSQLTFKHKFESTFSRMWRKGGYLALYLGCILIGLAPIMLPALRLMPPHQAILAFAVLGTVFFPLGGFALREAVRIARAEALLRSQHKLVQPILTAIRL